MSVNDLIFYQVAVDAPLWPDKLSYSSKESLTPGTIVNITLGKRKSLGVIISEQAPPEKIKIKEISSVDNQRQKLDLVELQLYQWISRYYHYPLGQLIFDSLPNPTKRIPKFQPIYGEAQSWEIPLPKTILEVISSLKENSPGEFSQHLLHGVTGSGKSLVYLNWIKHLIAQKKSVLYLVPEINLTPQFVEFFSKYLSCEVYVYHSQISVGKRYALYRYLKGSTSAVLVIAARSGVFLPCNNLGGIIIDEEHDSSYKQEDRCRYHARDVAVYKAKINQVPILLGSATPSLESYVRFRNQKSSKLYYYQLPERFLKQALPQVVHLTQPSHADLSWPFHPDLIGLIKETIEADGQVLIFINKLGFARYMMCQSCHADFQCPNCTVRLTYFKNRNQLECHLCEYKVSTPKSCPKCGCLDLWSQGFGTERVVEKLGEYFPVNKTLRIDRDESKTIADASKRFMSFEKGEYKILVGTQMITKGHNFQNVKLVVVLGIDAQLHVAEFRCREKVFQMLNQVAGRAGRFGDDSKVVVQTNMSHVELNDLLRVDLHHFYEEELKIRMLVRYPPARKMAQLTARSSKADRVKALMFDVKNRLQRTIDQYKLAVVIKGPKMTAIEKIKNQYGESILLLAENPEVLQKILHQFVVEQKAGSGVKLIIDVDPQQMS